LTNATANFAADVGVGGLSSGAYVNAVGNVSAGNVNVTGALRGTSAMLSPVNNSLGASITLNNTNFIDVTSVNQGANGTWLAQGVVTIGGGNSIATVTAKLWDGNTVMAASQFTHINSNGIAATATISLQGFITNPTGNIKISVKDNGPSNSTVFFNQSGTGRDTSLSAIRIG
jgi:hypothetical protein